MKRDRPQFPDGYGIEESPTGMLEWSEVSDVVGRAGTYWISTVRASGTPHLIPIWGGWDGRRLHIEGAPTTTWARALRATPRVVAGVEHDGYSVMIHGEARQRATEMFDVVADNYQGKYEYRPENNDFWIIEPSRVLAWRMTSMDDFSKTPTRFTFEEAA